MSLAESFLRGGAPCTTPSELAEVLSSAHRPYAHWRCVAYYPRRWHRDPLANKTTAPVFFLLFGNQEERTSGGSHGVTALTNEVVTRGEAAWHLLYYTVLPEGAVPVETFTHVQKAASGPGTGGDTPSASSEAALVSSGGGGVGALRALLRSLPATLMPSGSLEWYSVAHGIAHDRMGLLTVPVFLTKIVPAVSEVLGKYWEPMMRNDRESGSGETLGAPPASPQSTAHYVVDGSAVEVVDLFRAVGVASSAFLPRRRERCDDASVRSVVLPSSMSPPPPELAFVAATVHKAAQWLCTERKTAALVADASVPSITEAGWHIVYPLMASLRPCMFTSLFKEAANVGRSDDALLNADIESLTGMAKFRAERDAGIAQWKRQIGEFTCFTVPEERSEAFTGDASAAALVAEDGHYTNGLASLASPTLTNSTTTPAGGSYQHALLLQRPILAKRPIDIDNRDAGPPAPQPISAELHLVQDRGDIKYALEQLVNRANVHFVFEDTVHDDGEVLVQLTPVEGVPFCDLDEYFRIVPAMSTALKSGGADVYSGSCCPAVVPRVVYRRPTGKAQKANPIAHALTELESSSPTPAMVKAAAAALRYVSSQLVELTEPVTAASTTASAVCGTPAPGYTLHVPPIDFSSVTQRKCGWCDRWRSVLLRCGGCKAVSYCCKRHQSLDWKEGFHRVECKLWSRARELQDRVVAPWVAQISPMWTAVTAGVEPTSVPKTRGWSCAATLTHFLKDIDVPTRNARSQLPLQDSVTHYVHVVGLDTECIADFVHALSEDIELRQALASVTLNATVGARQYRILVCSDTFTDAQRNAVWAIHRCDTHPMCLTPPTEVLGDAWHCKGANEAATNPASTMALIRLSGVKYHTVERHLDPNREGCPQAVLSFGPPSGEGCTYLTAALEVFAVHDLGFVPLRLVDSSYVGAVRTRNAVAARVASSDMCSAVIKSHVEAFIARARQAESVGVLGDAAGSSDPARSPFLIRFNKAGSVARATTETPSPDAGSAPAGLTLTSVLTPYLNCFLWDVLPADCR
ncbi:hypothetical protein JKF63_02257 [Porcisia hertigi]|uniref:MYND-type domain-containing protein n=1 Tax=Porcisia hertigi TaxID=2761500 RepID=A0A836L2V7_9TRYP|nr:hypothetical protein JKF63_02257 [Porcisia hertigi]